VFHLDRELGLIAVRHGDDDLPPGLVTR
jgi:hypothetical protein